jgi:protein translocase SecG subunit
MLKMILLVSQFVLALLLIGAVLLQQRDSGLGAGFGGGSNGGVRATRRGPEKALFTATIVISVLFFVVSLAVVLL